MNIEKADFIDSDKYARAVEPKQQRASDTQARKYGGCLKYIGTVDSLTPGACPVEGCGVVPDKNTLDVDPDNRCQNPAFDKRY